MAVFTMVNGKTIWLMVLVTTIILMVRATTTKACGLKTSRMAKVRKFGLMVPSMKGNTKIATSMEVVTSIGQMDQLMKANG